MHFPKTAAMLNRTELTKSTPEVKVSEAAQKLFGNPPPAIVQEAQWDCAKWLHHLNTIGARIEHDAVAYRKGMKEFKESGVWKKVYKTWRDTCRNGLKLTPQTANRLIRELNENYCEEVEPPVPLSKNGHSSSTTCVEDQKDDEPEKPQVRSADEKTEPEEKAPRSTKPPIDVSGCVIPQQLLALRERRDEVTGLAYHASKLFAFFERLQSDKDPLWNSLKAAGNVQTFANSLSAMRYQIAECLPDVVCPQCGGKSPSCQYCCGTGWISEVRWNRDWVKSNDTMKQQEVAKRSANL